MRFVQIGIAHINPALVTNVREDGSGAFIEVVGGHQMKVDNVAATEVIAMLTAEPEADRDDNGTVPWRKIYWKESKNSIVSCEEKDGPTHVSIEIPSRWGLHSRMFKIETESGGMMDYEIGLRAAYNAGLSHRTASIRLLFQRLIGI